jgi:hypothetical protein
MKKTRLKIGPVALLGLLALLTLLVVKRQHLTAEETVDDAVRPVVTLVDTVVRHERAAIAFLALMALFAFVTWTALRAHEGEDKATPPAKEESSASGTTTFR